MKKGSVLHPDVGSLRWCWRCQSYRNISEFYTTDRQCKSCKTEYYREYHRLYYLKHRARLLPLHRASALRSIRMRKQS